MIRIDQALHIKNLLVILCFSILSVNQINAQSKPKNVILMIGDGMGTAHIYAGMVANHDTLNIERCLNIGFSKTWSASNFITDSGAGATAFATGKKTFNHAIGVGLDSAALPNLVELLSLRGLATGVVAVNSVTDATPASFVAHKPNRLMHSGIAIDYIHSPIDVIIGGGSRYFNQRSDSLNLIDSLTENGFEVYFNLETASKSNSEKLAVFTAPQNNALIIKGRGDMLQVASSEAIDALNKNPKGFFLMIEGSQIDFGGHDNDELIVISEVLDFDKAVGEVLDFAENDSNTLVIITADHETGGVTLVNGNIDEASVTMRFSSIEHTGVMVPVFAFGPGAESFRGIYDNVEIFNKIMAFYK